MLTKKIEIYFEFVKMSTYDNIKPFLKIKINVKSI